MYVYGTSFLLHPLCLYSPDRQHNLSLLSHQPIKHPHNPHSLHSNK